MTIELIPAERYSIQELADLYNQTRVDYVVPMPMNADRLAEYIRDFDINLTYSGVALTPDGQVLGLSMLGVRQPRTWITRLGVIPVIRRSGAGSALMDFMLANADALGMEETHLEVIKNNTPAHKLFLKKGFVENGEYHVMRRAPRPVSDSVQSQVEMLDQDAALEMLGAYPRHITWINAYNSMKNAPDVVGLRVELPNGGAGWLVCRHYKFSLSHLVLFTEEGDPEEVGVQLLLNLHTRYQRHDTYAENICVDDPHLPAFSALGYFDNFRRIEMRRPLNTANSSLH